ncbi:MAG: hypothetical protein AB1465_05485 [Patescibacteria group bacterium]
MQKFLNRFDFFALGNSAIIYWTVIFYFAPLASLSYYGYFLVDNSYSAKAVLYSLIGVLFFALGYFSRLPVFLAGKINPLKREWNFSRAVWVFGFIFISGWAVKLIKILMGGYNDLNPSQQFLQNPFYSLLGNLGWLSYIALAIAFISYFVLKKKNDSRFKFWGFLAWLAFGAEMIYAFPTCVRMGIIVPVVIYLIVRWYSWKKDFWPILVAIAAIVMFVFPFGNICRYGVTPDYFVKDVYSGENAVGQNVVGRIAKFGADSFLSRINQLGVFSAVVAMSQPLQYGKSFKEILLTFSPPRFIWKNKPLSVNASGNKFGHRIGVLSNDDYATHVGPTIIGDWYMNFGIFGIIFGMALTGIIFRAIYEYLIIKTEFSAPGIMIYAVLWFSFVKDIENWAAPVFSGAIRLFVILLAINYFLIKKNEDFTYSS